MPAPLLIVGQGLAGTVLAWTLEREGVDFEIIDRGHSQATSAIGAGIINPITGQRIVKSWRVDEFLPLARTVYCELERALACPLVTEMRIRRLFRDERERVIFADKSARGELAPYAGKAETDGFWIEGAMRVDLAGLIAAARRRWLAQGRVKEETITPRDARRRYDLTIFCTGAAEDDHPDFRLASLKRAKGEILTLRLARTATQPGVILNRGHWLLPLDERHLKVGATFEPDVSDLNPSAEAREELAASAKDLLGTDQPFDVVAQEVGLRVTTLDRHPVVGRAPHDLRCGMFNGLGSKGALLAPYLAWQWFNHLTEGVPFDPSVDIARFWK